MNLVAGVPFLLPDKESLGLTNEETEEKLEVKRLPVHRSRAVMTWIFKNKAELLDSLVDFGNYFLEKT